MLMRIFDIPSQGVNVLLLAEDLDIVERDENGMWKG
jgi:hypothetical protein